MVPAGGRETTGSGYGSDVTARPVGVVTRSVRRTPSWQWSWARGAAGVPHVISPIDETRGVLGTGSWRSAARTGAVAAVLVLVVVGIALGTGSIEAHDLITPGGRGPSARVIAEDFGDDAVDPGATGYDGQQTYAIARHFPDLDAAADETDSARYRMLRILPAVLAWPAPAGTPTVLALLVVNAIGFGIAVAAAVRLGETFGVEQRFAIVACLPLLFGLFGTTTGPIAWGLGLLALERVTRRRHVDAIVLFTLATLSRESVAVAAGLAALGLLLTDRSTWKIVPAYAIPGTVALVWFLILSELVGGRFVERVDVLGFLDLDGPESIVPGTIFVLGCVAAWAWRDVPSLAIPALGYTAWMAVYTPAILDDSAIIRVNALPIVLGMLGIGRLLSRTRSRAPTRPKRERVQTPS